MSFAKSIIQPRLTLTENFKSHVFLCDKVRRENALGAFGNYNISPICFFYQTKILPVKEILWKPQHKQHLRCLVPKWKITICSSQQAGNKNTNTLICKSLTQHTCDGARGLSLFPPPPRCFPHSAAAFRTRKKAHKTVPTSQKNAHTCFPLKGL